MGAADSGFRETMDRTERDEGLLVCFLKEEKLAVEDSSEDGTR